MDMSGEKIGYKEAWKVCKCGSKIFFNAYKPTSVPDLCNRCQEIANMKQTKLHEFDGNQKKIHHFDGNKYIEITNDFESGTLVCFKNDEFYHMFGNSKDIDDKINKFRLNDVVLAHIYIYDRHLSCDELKMLKKFIMS